MACLQVALASLAQATLQRETSRGCRRAPLRERKFLIRSRRKQSVSKQPSGPWAVRLADGPGLTSELDQRGREGPRAGSVQFPQLLGRGRNDSPLDQCPKGRA